MPFSAALVRSLSVQVKAVLHLTISQKVSDVQIVHQLLAQLGLKVGFKWSRKVVGHEGEKLRVYRFEEEVWQQIWEVLEQRAQRRAFLAQSEGVRGQSDSRAPRGLLIQNLRGDPDGMGVLGDEPRLSAWWGAHQLGAAIELGQNVVEAVLKPWNYEFQAQVLAGLAATSEVVLEQLLRSVPTLFD